MNENNANMKIQKLLGDNGPNPERQASETDSANFAINNRFYEEKEVKDDIETTISASSNIGAVLLPVNNDPR
ncbi:hypothetical protein WQ54_30850 [Bacillus sp. SA1-12]|uniref:hypothetical protein n=1 Tax=Bacillus sp. SA1-12 TaxID=1455638 RepID=UPI0006271FDB|nr:hypothetical protein [Bacillus sp. SA1-12]KKI88594.1 hypothetical protein WQ54_30850 [Bacillus sp. SA1-12]